MKKALALLLAGSMALSMFTACGSSKTPTGTPESTATSGEQLEGSLICKDPQTFSIFLTRNNMPFDSEWMVFQEAAKRTNVSLKSVIPKSNSNESEAFNLMVSSGELADIIGHSSTAEMEKLGRDGGLIDLTDLIDKYAPNIKKTMETDPVFNRDIHALDGKIYAIPTTVGIPTAEFWWIRQDWLDKLGLEVPTNVDELYNVLTAFRNNDPNGNGQKDEIPLFDRAGANMLDEFLYLFDSSTEFYARDGKIVFEPLEENFVTGVTNLAKWYKEGLIDPEIFTRGGKSRDILFGGDIGGMTHDWPSCGDYNDSLKNEVEGFNLTPIAPPADQNGNVVERTTHAAGSGWGISSTCKDPVTVIKYMDYFFTDEGSELINWGVEGETFKKNEDGTRSYTDAVMTSEMGPMKYLRTKGVHYWIGMKVDPSYEYAFCSESATEAKKLYEAHPEWYRADEPPYFDGVMNLKYPAEEEAEYQKIMSNIRPYVDEKFQSWLLGTSDFNAEYDEFVAELHDRGIDRAIEINQKAYDAFMANSK